MSILPGSRYANAPVITVPGTGNPRRVITVSPQQAPYSFRYQSYQMRAADTVQSLAAAFYGDPGQWWVIADANPQIAFFSGLEPGTIIRIPVS